jgi:hypothetical protein
MEDSGRISVQEFPEPLTTAEYVAWARGSCVTIGAHSGGGTPQRRDAATAVILAFLDQLR